MYYCSNVLLLSCIILCNIVAVNGTQMCTLIEMLYCSQTALGKSNLFYTFSNTTRIQDNMSCLMDICNLRTTLESSPLSDVNSPATDSFVCTVNSQQ